MKPSLFVNYEYAKVSKCNCSCNSDVYQNLTSSVSMGKDITMSTLLIYFCGNHFSVTCDRKKATKLTYRLIWATYEALGLVGEKPEKDRFAAYNFRLKI